MKLEALIKTDSKYDLSLFLIAAIERIEAKAQVANDLGLFLHA